MSEEFKVLVTFLVVFTIRLAIYQSRLWRITRLRNRYRQFLADVRDSGDWLAEQTTSYKRMITECGLVPSPLPVVPGPGLVPVEALPDDNITFRNAHFVDRNNQMMLRIQGHYRNERNRTFSPFYWIEFAVFLPREVLRPFGVGSEKGAVHVADLAWWIVIAWEVLAWVRGEGSLIRLLRAVAR
jgi:hypothetical protein